MSKVCVKLNWLNVHDRYLQFIVFDIFKYYINHYPDYFNEVSCTFDVNEVAMCSCNKKLKLPLAQVEIRNAEFFVFRV